MDVEKSMSTVDAKSKNTDIKYNKNKSDNIVDKNEYIISSVSEYLKVLENLDMDAGDYIYRGQNEHYDGIVASGLRPYGENNEKYYQLDNIKNDFYNQVCSNLSPKEEEYFLAYCQHHGLPTNLVDFTYSPLVALFFACHGKKNNEKKENQICDETNNDDKNCGEVYLIKKKKLIPFDEVLNFNNGIYYNILHNFINDIDFVRGFIPCFDNLLEDDKDKHKINKEILCALLNCFSSENFCNSLNQIDSNIKNNYSFKYEEVKNNILKNNINNEELLNNIKLLNEILFYHQNNNIYKIGNLIEKECFDCDFKYIELSGITQICMYLWIMIITNADYQQISENLNTEIYLTYNPPNLFERINNQKGLFIYQPVLGYKVMITQNVNPDITIKIKNHKKILNELDTLGINLAMIYGDADNVAKSVVETYKRKNDY